MNRFGYSASGLATLQSYYATLLSYAQATDNTGAVPISTVGIVQNLNFSNGTGAKLIAQQLSWDGYVSQLRGAIDGVIDARNGSGVDASDIIDWASNIVIPQLTLLSVSESISNTFAPTGNTALEALSNIPLWVKVGAGGLLGVIILGQLSPVLSLFKHLAPKKHSTAGYRRRRR